MARFVTLTKNVPGHSETGTALSVDFSPASEAGSLMVVWCFMALQQIALGPARARRMPFLKAFGSHPHIPLGELARTAFLWLAGMLAAT